MSKNILVLCTLLFSVNSFAADKVVSQECLDRLAANSATIKSSSIAVIHGENISEIKPSETVPVDVEVFNDAHYLLASLTHLTEPQELEARQIIVMEAVCGIDSYDAKSIKAVINQLPMAE